MAYKFKRQIFGFMDLLRFKKMVPTREKMLAEGSAEPLPKTFRVNETAKILHPGTRKVKLAEIRDETHDIKTFVFETFAPSMFRAGQYVSLRARIGGSVVSRPYAISSSPFDALRGNKVAVTIKRAGFFSKWMCDNAALGDEFELGDPSGDFFHDGVRDSRRVLGIAGGSGITPFFSMAQAISEGSEDFELTLLYGAKTVKDLAFKDRLDALCGDKFKVVYVLSDEKKDGFEHGFITAELISKYAQGDFTVMMCGPQVMYDFAEKELAKIGVTGARRVRKEANCVSTRDVKPQEFKLRVHIRDEAFDIKADARETLLTAMERAGLQVPSKCRAGGCGFCHSRSIRAAPIPIPIWRSRCREVENRLRRYPRRSLSVFRPPRGADRKPPRGCVFTERPRKGARCLLFILSSYGSAADSMFFYFIQFGGGFDVLYTKILRTDF